MKKNPYNMGMRIIAIFCLISILLTSCTSNVSKYENFQYIDAEYSGNEYHKAPASAYQTITKSGLIELLFDKNTATVAIRNTNTGTLWTTLPGKKVAKEIQSSALQITLSDGNDKIYTLNTQDNSVAHGNFTYTTSVDGISVTYSMALNKETGKKEISKVKNGEIRADLTILYSLRDGSFYVNVNMNNVILPDGIYLEDITVLKNFGAYETGGGDDYLFVPDGSGAILKTGVNDDDFSPISLSVYGNDVAISDSREQSQCLIGAFGIKRSDDAFLCIIEKGDSVARINATRNDENNLNSVNSTFKITEIFSPEIRGNQYKNEIQLCYRFLSGKSATYSGMATACRENLIRNAVLSTKSVETSSEYIPMVVSLQGGYRNSKGKYFTLSNYKQALSLMSLLKAKGVNNVYLRYNGLYDNANNGNTDSFNDFKGSLGNKTDFNELYSYLSSQKFFLFIDTDILTYSNQLSGAKSITNNRITDSDSYDFPKSTDIQEYLTMSKLEDKIEDILTDSEKVDFDGYSLNDAGAYLYSDYSYDTYSRSLSQSELNSQISVLSTSKMLMIDTGNFYSVKNADVISNIPVSTCVYPETDAYKGIPFVQMLLHGISEYSTSGLNTYDVPEMAFLKAIEYGCLPSADWYCSAFDKAIDSKYYYDNNINQMVTYYDKANTTLSELRDSRMTSHTEVTEGVYCTEYDNSTRVYVNYTDKNVTVNGVTVNAMDCITIS